MNPRKHYCVMGPVPLPAIADVVSQIEEQGWTVRFVTFGGMAVISAIAMPGSQQVPAFAVISDRLSAGQGSPMLPKIHKGGNNAPDNH